MKVALISQFRNEAKFLKEWLEFHIMIGIDKFYLIDHCSNDNPIKVLQTYIDKKIVVYYRESQETNTEINSLVNQEKTLELFLNNLNRFAKIADEEWIMYLSLDEFILPDKKFSSIKEFLLSIPSNVGQVGINNKTFGHFNQIIGNNEMLIEKLTMSGNPCNEKTLWQHTHVKSFVRKSALEYYDSSHYAIISKNYLSVDSSLNRQNYEDGILFKTINLNYDNVRINHYRWRDILYASEKTAFYENWGHKDTWGMNEHAIFEEEYDNDIYRYVPKLKEKLFQS